MDNFFSYDFTEGRMDLPPEAIGPLGSNCFSRGSILLILRKPIWLLPLVISEGAGSGPLVPALSPLWIRPRIKMMIKLSLTYIFQKEKTLIEHENTTNSHGRNKKRIAICFLFINTQHCRLQQNKLKHTG